MTTASNSAPLETKLFIPEFRVDALRAAVEKLGRKAAKLGLSPITFKLTGNRETRDFATTAVEHYEDGNTSVRSTPTKVEAVEVEITGESPTLAGWSFAASVDPVEDTGRNVLSKSPFFTGEIPLRYRSATQECEHCKLTRNRKGTFVLSHIEGDFKQVGRQCLKDFLGNLDPKALLSAAALFSQIYDLCGEAGEFEGSCGSRDISYGLKSVLVIVYNLIKEYGFTSVSKAREIPGVVATKDYATAVLNPVFGVSESVKFADKFSAGSPEALAKAEAVIEWARGLDLDDQNDYIANLAAAFLTDGVNAKRLGIVCSAVTAHTRHLGQLAERAREATKTNEHVGVVGEKIERPLTLVRLTPIEGNWGCATLCILEDAEGRSFKWFASNCPFADADLGQTLSIKGTIKSHDEFKGRKQTSLTRAKIVVPKVAKTKVAKARKIAPIDPSATSEIVSDCTITHVENFA